MNKKAATLWFILGATLFNILVSVLCFVALLFLYARFLIPLIPSPETTAAWGFPFIFIAAVVLSFVIYRFALKRLLKRMKPDTPFFFGKDS
jgi:membrane protein implicated in regulation of membrane protease activity